MEKVGADFDQVASAWYSQLLAKGSLVKNMRTKKHSVVLAVLTCGVLLWEVALRKVGDQSWFDLVSGSADPWTFEVCSDMKPWRAIAIKARPPS